MRHMENDECSRVRRRFCQLLIAITFLIVWGQANSGPAFGDNPFDGMSALDIELNALESGHGENFSDSRCSTDPVELLSTGFMSFEFVELKGGELHEIYQPIQGSPTPGEIMALAKLTGPWNTADFELVSEDETASLQNIVLEPNNLGSQTTFFFGTVDVPNQAFKVKVPEPT